MSYFTTKNIVLLFGFGCGFTIGKARYERERFNSKIFEISDAITDIEQRDILLFKLVDFMLEGLFEDRWEDDEWVNLLYENVVFLNMTAAFDEDDECE